ncbi:MAG: hypothetical protein AAGI66_09950 [Cyanobacteria bacterium P01_H01_bin.74]
MGIIVGVKYKLTLPEAKYVFDTVDANKNGEITREEARNLRNSRYGENQERIDYYNFSSNLNNGQSEFFDHLHEVNELYNLIGNEADAITENALQNYANLSGGSDISEADYDIAYNAYASEYAADFSGIAFDNMLGFSRPFEQETGQTKQSLTNARETLMDRHHFYDDLAEPRESERAKFYQRVLDNFRTMDTDKNGRVNYFELKAHDTNADDILSAEELNAAIATGQPESAYSFDFSVTDERAATILNVIRAAADYGNGTLTLEAANQLINTDLTYYNNLNVEEQEFLDRLVANEGEAFNAIGLGNQTTKEGIETAIATFNAKVSTGVVYDEISSERGTTILNVIRAAAGYGNGMLTLESVNRLVNDNSNYYNSLTDQEQEFLGRLIANDGRIFNAIGLAGLTTKDQIAVMLKGDSNSSGVSNKDFDHAFGYVPASE